MLHAQAFATTIIASNRQHGKMLTSSRYRASRMRARSYSLKLFHLFRANYSNGFITAFWLPLLHFYDDMIIGYIDTRSMMSSKRKFLYNFHFHAAAKCLYSIFTYTFDGHSALYTHTQFAFEAYRNATPYCAYSFRSQKLAIGFTSKLSPWEVIVDDYYLYLLLLARYATGI